MKETPIKMQTTAANWLCLQTYSELLIYKRINLLLKYKEIASSPHG